MIKSRFKILFLLILCLAISGLVLAQINPPKANPKDYGSAPFDLPNFLKYNPNDLSILHSLGPIGLSAQEFSRNVLLLQNFLKLNPEANTILTKHNNIQADAYYSQIDVFEEIRKVFKANPGALKSLVKLTEIKLIKDSYLHFLGTAKAYNSGAKDNTAKPETSECSSCSQKDPYLDPDSQQEKVEDLLRQLDIKIAKPYQPTEIKD